MTAPAAPASPAAPPPPPSVVKVTIEGITVEVAPGTSILEAAKHAGVLIPHYCYHPGLPVAGVCRMCLVDVEKFPKLAPACATAVADGQVVHVHNEKAKKAREGVLEFLLINHPLDCPICDQAGECELQDYTFQEGRADSRYREPKRFNPVEDFGGDVLYVPNRCILCTRCVRFMADVAKEPVLNVSERGDRAFIGKAEGHDLTHEWAGNVVDLCPVGALLSKDFLNKARAWELDRAASVCTGCSQGCNIVLETRDNTVVRVKPRTNTDVNQYYACETGRMHYRWMNRRDRLEQPVVRDAAGTLAPVSWEQAVETAARVLGAASRVVVLASPGLSNEALYLLTRIRGPKGAGVFRMESGPEAPLVGAPDLSLRADRAPNGRGAELLGYTRHEQPLASLAKGDVLLVADHDLANVDVSALDRAASVVVIGTTLPDALSTRAAVALPTCNVAEEEGTFTNLRGRVQRFLQAKAAPGEARPTWSVIGDVAEAMGRGAAPMLPAEVFAAMSRDHAAFGGLNYGKLGLRGLPVLEQAGASA
jgi:NADH-quinone oxidoreductase subunit G